MALWAVTIENTEYFQVFEFAYEEIVLVWAFGFKTLSARLLISQIFSIIFSNFVTFIFYQFIFK